MLSNWDSSNPSISNPSDATVLRLGNGWQAPVGYRHLLWQQFYEFLATNGTLGAYQGNINILQVSNPIKRTQIFEFSLEESFKYAIVGQSKPVNLKS